MFLLSNADLLSSGNTRAKNWVAFRHCRRAVVVGVAALRATLVIVVATNANALLTLVF